MGKEGWNEGMGGGFDIGGKEDKKVKSGRGRRREKNKKEG